jgi:phosphoribosyl-ATP pyrophosphohydrolase
MNAKSKTKQEIIEDTADLIYARKANRNEPLVNWADVRKKYIIST